MHRFSPMHIVNKNICFIYSLHVRQTRGIRFVYVCVLVAVL